MALREELGFPNPIESRPHEAILNVLMTGTSIVKEADKILKPFGLTVTQLNVLMILKYQTPAEGVSQTQLGEMLLVNRSNVTGLVDRMEKAGLVVRRDDPDDRRTKFVRVTSKGAETLLKAEGKYFETMEHITRDFKEKEVDRLCEQMAKIRSRLKERED